MDLPCCIRELDFYRTASNDLEAVMILRSGCERVEAKTGARVVHLNEREWPFALVCNCDGYIRRMASRHQTEDKYGGETCQLQAAHVCFHIALFSMGHLTRYCKPSPRMNDPAEALHFESIFVLLIVIFGNDGKCIRGYPPVLYGNPLFSIGYKRVFVRRSFIFNKLQVDACTEMLCFQ